MGNKANKLPKTKNDVKDLCVGISHSEIDNWYTQYKESLSPGKDYLEISNFVSVYNKLFPGDGTEYANHVFRTFDTNGDGLVDFKEFLVGIHVSAAHGTEEKLKWAFKVYDIDGDGYVTKHEMIQIINAICSMTGTKLPSDDFIDGLFKKMDMNNDDLISESEFLEKAAEERFIVDILELDPEQE